MLKHKMNRVMVSKAISNSWKAPENLVKKNYVKYELQLTRYAYAHPTQLRMCTVTHKQTFSSKGKGHMNILSKVAAFPP